MDQQIHLEMAPTCNVQIGAVAELAAHPIGPFLRLGFNVGVNTDNRLMSGVTVSGELHAVATTFELSSGGSRATRRQRGDVLVLVLGDRAAGWSSVSSDPRSPASGADRKHVR